MRLFKRRDLMLELCNGLTVPSEDEMEEAARKMGYTVIRGAEGSWDFSGLRRDEVSDVIDEIEEAVEFALEGVKNES